jgi:hypothetical protein
MSQPEESPARARAPVKPLGEADMPGINRAADSAAAAGQREYLRFTRVRLSCVIVAAAAGAWAAFADKPAGWHKALAAIAVASFILAFAAEIWLLTRRPEELWYHGRAIAESSKTLAWRYAMRADPFAVAEKESDTDARIIGRIRELMAGSSIASRLPMVTGDNITAAMRTLRAATLDERKRAYIGGRVTDQQAWYDRKARYNSNRATLWRIALIVLELAGALWAVLILAGVTRLVLDGVLAAMIAAAGAWLEVKQFDNLAEAYSLTAIELGFVRSEAESVSDEPGWSSYVNSAERAISREHTMWLARRVKPGFGESGDG